MLLSIPRVVGYEEHSFLLQKVNTIKLLKGGSVIQ